MQFLSPYIYGNSLGSINILDSEGLLLITCYNSSIDVSPTVVGGINMKKPCLMITGVLWPSDWVNWPGITLPFFSNSYGVRCSSPPRPHQEFIHSSRLSHHCRALRCRGKNYSIYYMGLIPSVISPLDNPSVPCSIMSVPATWMTCILKAPSVSIFEVSKLA